MKAIFCKLLSWIRAAFQAITKRGKSDVRVKLGINDSQITVIVQEEEENEEDDNHDTNR